LETDVNDVKGIKRVEQYFVQQLTKVNYWLKENKALSIEEKTILEKAKQDIIPLLVLPHSLNPKFNVFKLKFDDMFEENEKITFFLQGASVPEGVGTVLRMRQIAIKELMLFNTKPPIYWISGKELKYMRQFSVAPPGYNKLKLALYLFGDMDLAVYLKTIDGKRLPDNVAAGTTVRIDEQIPDTDYSGLTKTINESMQIGDSPLQSYESDTSSEIKDMKGDLSVTEGQKIPLARFRYTKYISDIKADLTNIEEIMDTFDKNYGHLTWAGEFSVWAGNAKFDFKKWQKQRSYFREILKKEEDKHSEALLLSPNEAEQKQGLNNVHFLSIDAYEAEYNAKSIDQEYNNYEGRVKTGAGTGLMATNVTIAGLSTLATGGAFSAFGGGTAGLAGAAGVGAFSSGIQEFGKQKGEGEGYSAGKIGYEALFGGIQAALPNIKNAKVLSALTTGLKTAIDTGGDPEETIRALLASAATSFVGDKIDASGLGAVGKTLAGGSSDVLLNAAILDQEVTMQDTVASFAGAAQGNDPNQTRHDQVAIGKPNSSDTPRLNGATTADTPPPQHDAASSQQHDASNNHATTIPPTTDASTQPLDASTAPKPTTPKEYGILHEDALMQRSPEHFDEYMRLAGTWDNAVAGLEGSRWKHTILFEIRERIAAQISAKFDGDVLDDASSSPKSDMDFNIKGKDAGKKLLAAEAYMDKTYGKNWKEKFKMSFFTDAERLTMYTETQGKISNEQFASMEARVTDVSTKYNIAKMLQHAGTDSTAKLRVERLLAGRADAIEIRSIAAQSPAEIEVSRVRLHKEIDRLMERKEKAKTPEDAARLAEKISVKQAEANFCTSEAYIGAAAMIKIKDEDQINLRDPQLQQRVHSQLEMIEHQIAAYKGSGKAAQEYEVYKYISRFIETLEAHGQVLSPDMQLFKDLAPTIYTDERDFYEHIGKGRTEAERAAVIDRVLNEAYTIAKKTTQLQVTQM
jgi:hypothetical protein